MWTGNMRCFNAFRNIQLKSFNTPPTCLNPNMLYTKFIHFFLPKDCH